MAGPIVLAPLLPLAGQAVLALGKGGLTRAATHSLVSGAAFQAGAEIVAQIAEWARGIGGEFDTTDDTGGINGCAEMKPGGYGQYQYRLEGGSWSSQTDIPIYTRAVRIAPQPAFPTGGGTWTKNCEVYSADDGTTDGIGGFATEGEANAVQFRILPTEGECANSESGGGHDWNEALPLPPMESNGCQINVEFHGFLAAEDGTGTVRPVFEWTPAVPPGRANGGVITGECNFQPTISVGGGGDGGDPPIILPGPGGPGGPFPPRSDGWWEAIAKGAAAGAVGAIVNQILNGVLTEQAAASFTLVAPCDVNDDGEPLTATWNFPPQSAPTRTLAHQSALMEIMQQHLNWKTPTCGNEQQPGEGDWRTISFRSDKTSPYGKSRLRKRFRYRSTSGWSYDDLINHWKDFVWQSGPVVVKHLGADWGAPQVWAATADEGKRVIRHAAGEAGIDPDQVGRWSISGSRSSRLGVSDTMRVETKGGYYWITARDGSDARPLVGVVPHPGSGFDITE